MEENLQRGKQSLSFQTIPCILEESSVAGKKEGEGPLGVYFDAVENDPMFGGTSWEEAESILQSRALEQLLTKANKRPEDVRYLLGGDLLGQLIATSFGIKDYKIPLFGLYGACSTMGESMALGAMLVAGGFADMIVAITSSHFASAEKQFRFPLAYGNQRPLAATYTVTGSGAVLLGRKKDHKKEGECIGISGITTGCIVDYGVKDALNMGACMAPAAADLIAQHFLDFEREEAYYDKIITGDLGLVGKEILIHLLREKGYDIEKNHMDCGIEVFDPKTQDTHAGGSGCGCSAITLAGFILRKMRRGEWRRILFVPTGALLSTVSSNEGNSVPAIAHGIVMEVM
ncbi:MAG: stage sporulation protein [Clostridiales bacterium]|nr:stage sporulation protein [Clostridiales bacterium]